MNVREWGSARRTIVCLHSLGTDGRMWESFAQQLAGDFRLVAPDLGDVGDDSSGAPFTFRRAADLLNEIISGRAEAPVALVGIGFGALAAMQVAAEHPTLVGSLLLMSSYVNIPGGGSERIVDTRSVLERGGIERFAADYAHDTITTSELADAERLIASQIARTGTDTFMAELIAAMQFDGRDLLPRIAAPVLVMTGDRDQRTSERDGRAVSQLLPRATFELVENCGHLIPIDRPAFFAHRARNWIAEN